MTAKNRWQVVLAGLTVALLACEQSITNVPLPEAEAARPVEAVASIALLTNEGCFPAPAGLISWWTGDETFDDIAPPIDLTKDPSPNDITFVSFGLGVENHHNDTHGDGGRTDPDGTGVHGPVGITVEFAEVGKVGQAFRFTPEGKSKLSELISVEYLEVVDAPDLRPEEFTIDMWAKRTGAGQNGDDPFGNVLITKAISDRPDDPNPRTSYDIYWNKAGKIRARVHFLDGTVTLDSPTTFGAENVWVHIALTVDGSTVRLYVNGVEVPASPGMRSGSVKYGVGSVVVGSSYRWARRHDYPRGFHGLIDEVDIFDHALSSTEIMGIYGAGSAGKCEITDNTEPEPDAGADADIDEGGTFTSEGSFTDPDADSWIVSVDYGDGSPPEELTPLANKTFGLSHDYADDGIYEVTVTVDDQVADPVSATATVVVNNVPPNRVSGPEDQMIFESEGGTYASSVSFDDPGADEWTAMVDYGDGSVETLEMVEKTFPISHTYEGNEQCGPFALTVTVMDDDFKEGDVLEEDASASAQVTFIHQISVSRSSVKLDRRRRHSRDQLDVSGRLPRSLIGCLTREDEVSIEFGGLEWTLPPRSLRHRNRWWQKKWYFTGRGSNPIRRLDFHDNGRFTIQVRSEELRGLSGLIPFSISFGPDSGETEVRIRGRRGRSDRGRSDKSGKSDKSGRSGKSGGSRR